MTQEEHCPVCNAEDMPEDMIDLADLPHSWVNTSRNECIKGATHVTAKYHGIELYDLTDEELFNMMKDVALCAKALKKVTGAVKINYEIHGNTIPHLHVHLYPRYMDDPFPGQPIDYNRKSDRLYEEGEYERFVEGMKQELSKLYHDID